jgi:hypothetical protein
MIYELRFDLAAGEQRNVCGTRLRVAIQTLYSIASCHTNARTSSMPRASTVIVELL